jgi:Family of unknown function (DUF6455)
LYGQNVEKFAGFDLAQGTIGCVCDKLPIPSELAALEGTMTTQTTQNQNYPVVEAFIDKVTAWMRQWKDASAARDEFARCGCDEVARMAHDFGLSSAELTELARRGPDSTTRLPQMLAALGIDGAAVSRTEPAVMRDLERLCSMCERKHECSNQLAAGRAEASYHDFCPNADTLDALRLDVPKAH